LTTRFSFVIHSNIKLYSLAICNKDKLDMIILNGLSMKSPEHSQNLEKHANHSLSVALNASYVDTQKKRTL